MACKMNAHKKKYVLGATKGGRHGQGDLRHKPLSGRILTDGIERALKQARKAAGEKDVTVIGGAETGQQYIRAGLIDELSIHLVPVLFGSGTRMFENLGDEHLQLANGGSIQSSAATHLRFRIAR